ncbi:hypothetical protein C8R44DRAFT_989851 [Mycena epipterygia]|nr:hypothetical protein C8R44DRAFT_989851 [Mycena epipterygia]
MAHRSNAGVGFALGCPPRSTHSNRGTAPRPRSPSHPLLSRQLRRHLDYGHSRTLFPSPAHGSADLTDARRNARIQTPAFSALLRPHRSLWTVHPSSAASTSISISSSSGGGRHSFEDTREQNTNASTTPKGWLPARGSCWLSSRVLTTPSMRLRPRGTVASARTLQLACSPRRLRRGQVEARLCGWFAHLASSTDDSLAATVNESSEGAGKGLLDKAVRYLLDEDAAPDRSAQEIWLLGVLLPGWGLEDERRVAQAQHAHAHSTSNLHFHSISFHAQV